MGAVTAASGVIYGATTQGSVFAIKDGDAPNTLWRQTTGKHFLYPDVAVSSGKLWLISDDFTLRSFSTQNGQGLDTFSLAATGRIYSVGAESALVAILDDRTIARINPDNGSILWQKSLQADSWSRPVPVAAGLLVTDTAGHCLLLSIKTGETLWSYDAGGAFYAAPLATDSGLVALPNQMGTVFAINLASGQKVWSHTLLDGKPILTTAVGSSKQIITCDQQGRVFSLDAQTGREQWGQRFSQFTQLPLVVAGNTVVVTLGDGTVLGLSPSNGTTQWRVSLDAVPSAAPTFIQGKLWVSGSDGQLFILK